MYFFFIIVYTICIYSDFRTPKFMSHILQTCNGVDLVELLENRNIY